MTILGFWGATSGLGRLCIFLALAVVLATGISELFILADGKSISAQLQLLQDGKQITIINAALSFYVKNFQYFWYAIFLLLFVGLFRPFKNSFSTPESLVIQFAISVIISISFLVVSLIYISRLPIVDSGYYTVVIGVFTVLSVSIGWLISSQLSRRHDKKLEDRANHHHKRTHTLNLILQLNTSSDYHEKMDLINGIYPMGSIICEEDVRSFLTGADFSGDDAGDKSSAMTSVGLMLDTYEFIFEGIAQGDLDEDVIYESIGGGIIRNVKRASKLINAIRLGVHCGKPLPKVFCRLVEYYHIWEPKHSNDALRYQQNIKKIEVVA
jgi:hypothetical protein